MEEYIKREDAKQAITWNGLSEPPEIIHLTLLTAQKNIRHIPKADVVPKSEFEKLLSKCERLENTIADGDDFCNRCNMNHITKIRDSKSEVASEIFDAIEKYMMDFVDVTHTAYKEIGTSTFAELKKKYTEEKT